MVVSPLRPPSSGNGSALGWGKIQYLPFVPSALLPPLMALTSPSSAPSNAYGVSRAPQQAEGARLGGVEHPSTPWRAYGH